MFVLQRCTFRTTLNLLTTTRRAFGVLKEIDAPFNPREQLLSHTISLLGGRSIGDRIVLPAPNLAKEDLSEEVFSSQKVFRQHIFRPQMCSLDDGFPLSQRIFLRDSLRKVLSAVVIFSHRGFPGYISYQRIPS